MARLRNRQERRASKVYKLESLFRDRPDRSPLSEAELEKAPPHVIDGEIENIVFVSVPQTTSFHSCERLKEILEVAYFDKKREGKAPQKQIVILTHNIELLQITKLDAAVGAAIIKGLQGRGDKKACELCRRPYRPDDTDPTEDPAAKIITGVSH